MKNEHLTNVQEIQRAVQTEVSDIRIEADEMEAEVQKLEQEMREAQMAAEKREQEEREAENLENQIERIAQ
ncbi:MAG TPA: hypothetical protein PLD54_01680 [Candidatus Levybacteria bacterium]|nr:hypothetical protein [Candidatus Levybacteria bacterium]